jgi:hypothetical protein
MASQQQKLKKKKDREKRVRKKILLQREALRAPAREERKFQKKLDRIGKLKKELGDLNVWADEVFLNMSDKNLSQLERNAQILKALEEEYKKEHDKKSALNKELEEAGLLTLEDKLSHLHNKLVDQAKKLYEEGGLEATEAKEPETSDELNELLAQLDKPKKDVAEVEVLRAPTVEV